MPLIQLRDGVSMDEHILDATYVGYSAEGECTIEHPRYGTVGKLYDPETKTFSEVVEEPESIVGAMSVDEAMTMDIARKRDPLQEKLLSSIIREDYTDEQAIRHFAYLIEAGILNPERAEEIMFSSKYSHLRDEMFGPTETEVDSLESVAQPIDTEEVPPQED